MESSPEPLTPYAQGEVQSARTFALIGFIFFAVMAAIWALVVSFSAVATFTFMPGSMMPFFPGFFPLVVPFGVFLALSGAFAVWSWGVLKEVEAGLLPKAESSSLILGIFGLFPPIGAVVSGVFFLLAYSKLTNALRYAQTPPPWYAPPAAAVPRVCPECGRPVVAGAKFCHSCGAELAA